MSYNYYRDAPKPIKCKDPKCTGKMMYKNNVYRVSTDDWYEVYRCYRCFKEYVKGDPDVKDKKK